MVQQQTVPACREGRSRQLANKTLAATQWSMDTALATTAEVVCTLNAGGEWETAAADVDYVTRQLTMLP